MKFVYNTWYLSTIAVARAGKSIIGALHITSRIQCSARVGSFAYGASPFSCLLGHGIPRSPRMTWWTLITYAFPFITKECSDCRWVREECRLCKWASSRRRGRGRIYNWITNHRWRHQIGLQGFWFTQQFIEEGMVHSHISMALSVLPTVGIDRSLCADLPYCVKNFWLLALLWFQ